MDQCAKQVFIFFILWNLGWVDGSFAYIPPSQFITKTWVKKHSAIKGLKFKSVVTGYHRNKPTEVHFKETMVYDPHSLLLRRWALDDADKKLYFYERKLNSASVFSQVLMSHDLEKVMGALKEVGIPIQTEQELLAVKTEVERTQLEKESLLNWNGTIAWVIGALSDQESLKPQIWFEKDTFLPLRMIYSRSSDDPIYDFRLEGVRYLREFPYPKSITVWKNVDIILNSQLSDFIGEIDNIRSGSMLPGFTEVGKNAPSNLRDLIQKYYELFG